MMNGTSESCYDLQGTTFCFEQLNCEVRCDEQCEFLSADRMFNLFIYFFNVNNASDPEAEYERVGLSSFREGFACNYRQFYGKYGKENIIVSSADKSSTSFFTVPDCLHRCPFRCEPREVGIYARSLLSGIQKMRPLLLYDCAPPGDAVFYTVGILMLVLIFGVFVTLWWVIPMVKFCRQKKKQGAAPDASSDTRSTAPQYFKSLDARKTTVPNDFFKNLSLDTVSKKPQQIAKTKTTTKITKKNEESSRHAPSQLTDSRVFGVTIDTTTDAKTANPKSRYQSTSGSTDPYDLQLKTCEGTVESQMEYPFQETTQNNSFYASGV